MTTGPEIARQAKEQLVQLTGLKADTVSELAHGEDGWRVAVELVEMKRIPESSDMLASYEALLDEKGTLISYKRVRRYLRGQEMSEQT